ncbi:MAG: histidine kinase [Saprospiraceae bacterium]|nr:histidine kinase [Saprospiraceae bacterium]
MIIFINFIPYFANTQTNFPNLTFRSITTKDGLTSNNISGITQGDDGQMWIATGNGLNSFDGNNITNYYQGANSIFNINMSGIFTIAKDNKNNLWLSDRIGITKISLQNKTATYFSEFQDVYNFCPIENGICFITKEGIFHKNENNVRKTLNILPKYIFQNKNSDRYFKISLDKKNNFYLSSNTRVHKITTEGVEKKYFQIPKGHYVTNLYFDQHNKGWVSTWGQGLYLISPNADNLQQVLKPEHSNFITGAAAEWHIGNSDYQLVGFESFGKFGILIINKSTLSYILHEFKSKVNTFYIDSNNNLWIGTNSGILIASNLFGSISTIPIITTRKNHLLNPGSIYTIHETKDHFWLTKRYGHGIFKYDKNWNLVHEFGSYQIKNVPHYPFITDGYDFRLVGNTMYATSDLGMFLIDNTTHSFKHIFTPEHAEVKLRNIIPVNDTTWFIRSYDKGIYVFNPKKNDFPKKYRLQHKNESAISNYLIKTSRNDIVVATNNLGLFFYDSLLDKFIRKDHLKLNQLAIFGMAEDQNSTLWLCTNKGIMNYDPDKNIIINDFSQYSDMGMAYRVNIDKNNNIWFSNAKGYWSWSQQNKRMLKINFDSGLISEVEDNYIHIGSDGMLYLGGIDMVHKLNPAHISETSDKPRVIISKVSVNNEIKFLNFIQNRYKLQLPPGNATIEVAFAVPDYSMEHSHDYQFRFTDKDKWTTTSEGKIIIPSLTYGEHQIQLKGISNFSGKETDVVLLEITILPFWYQTWMFKIAIILLLVSMVVSFIVWNHKRVRSESNLKQMLTETKISALRAQMNPHFIFNCINSIDALIQSNDKYQATQYLNKFARLIRNILNSSRDNLIDFAKDLEMMKLYLELELLRNEDKFTVEYDIDPELTEGNYIIPPMVVHPYIENAIIHGLRNKFDNTGLLKLTAKLKYDVIEYTIEDNGIGIEAAGKLRTTDERSYGMQLGSERIKYFNQDDNFEIQIEDLNDGVNSGTKIVIKLKYR